MDSLSDILDRLEEHECHGVEVVIEVTDEDSENEDGNDVNRLSSNQLAAPTTLQRPHQLSDRSSERDDEIAATTIKKEEDITGIAGRVVLIVLKNCFLSGTALL